MLNAREATLLPFAFDALSNGDAKSFQRLMQGEAERFRLLLGEHGVNYENLKSALQPTPNGRHQVVFLYDWWEDPALNYAVAFAQRYLPKLRRTMRSSVLHGDLHNIGSMKAPVADLERSRVQGASERIDWNTQHAVYFSNLTTKDVSDLHTVFLGSSQLRV